MEDHHHNIPLSAAETSTLWTSYQKESMANCGLTQFLQHVEDEQIQSIIEYTLEISKDRIDKLTHFFHADGHPIPQGFTEHDINLDAPRLFSDKLMMFLVSVLSASGIGQYGVSMAASPRHDLGVHYTRLMAEIAHYAEDGANIMIDHSWMEQPSMAADRKDLAK